MPRNPGARPKQQNGHGLVGPGKRVTKQKSNNALDGTARGPVPIDPVPSTAAASAVSQTATSQHRDSLPSYNSDPSTRPTLPVRDSEESADGLPQEPAKTWEAANGAPMASARRSDAYPAKLKSSQEVTALQIASTILRSRPAYDTIALLIMLLALPSMMLTIVQAVFASLTLVPGGFSPFEFNLQSLLDIFQGSVVSPSLGVMAWVDLILFGLWICLWNWAQHFALDLAQIHIAMTLGNGSSGKAGSANSICFAIVLLLHTGRSRGVRRFITTKLIPANLFSQTGIADFLQYLPSDSDFGDTPGPSSKFRSLFAIHILSQALISFVRRRVASTQPVPTAKSSKRAEIEGLNNIHDAPISHVSNTGAIATGSDFHQPPTPGPRDGKEKSITAKKRRRQANSVRSKQPFWAALASTKVYVMREVEHTSGLPTVASIPNSPFDNPQQNTVWITDVDPASIQFEATFPTKPGQAEQESCPPEDGKPFHIRINGARWHSVSIEPHHNKALSEDSTPQWTGEISGLAPNCTYTCSFRSCHKDKELAVVMVKTPALEDSDYIDSVAPAPGSQSARPSSPTTTLKSSITSAEIKLAEARKRLQQLKRSHRSSIGKVEKEVDVLNGRLKSGADDTKLRQKLLQTERNMRQNEDANNSIKYALDTLDTVPEDGGDDYDVQRAAYERQKTVLAEANSTLAKAKSEADNELCCISGELNSISSRKERMQTRQTRLNEQHDRITQANAQGLNEKERKEGESARREADSLRREADLQTHMNHMTREAREYQMRSQANWREIELLEKQDLAQRQKLMMSAGPLTPEGELPGTRPPPQSARPFAFGSVNVPLNNHILPEKNSPFLAFANTLPSDDSRRARSDTNRSAGATSNFSADFEDADPIPPLPAEYELNGRKGSGSSRGKNNGSPAGVIGGAMRSPQRAHGSNSPGHHLPSSTTW